MKIKCPKCSYTWFDDDVDKPRWVCLVCGQIYKSEAEKEKCNHKGTKSESQSNLGDLCFFNREKPLDGLL